MDLSSVRLLRSHACILGCGSSRMTWQRPTTPSAALESHRAHLSHERGRLPCRAGSPGRLERRRPGPDVVGVVAAVKVMPAVNDYVVGFRAGARCIARDQGSGRLLERFRRPAKCEAMARSQIANGAGAVFDVAGDCGLGALAAAKEADVWGIGVDREMSSLGPHILTSVVKRFDVGFSRCFARRGPGGFAMAPNGAHASDGAVGLGRISPKVPAGYRRELDRLRRQIVAGKIRVPGVGVGSALRRRRPFTATRTSP